MRIQLGTREVGEGCPAYVIAEGGINHNGDPSLAKRLIDVAADAGADAIKFQMRDVETVYGREPYAPGYLDQPRAHPLSDDQTQRGQKTALEFPPHVHEQLMMYARERDLDYTVSCWDESSVARAAALGVSWLKVASPCITDGPLLRAHADTGLPLVVSTGGCDEATVSAALRVLRRSDDAQLALLHCCSTYPSEDSELNLRAVETLRSRFACVSGYSGHEKGIATTVAAVALGASIVERHLTLDRSAYGSDQAASLEPHGFARMVRDIRSVEAALGDGVKRVQPREEAIIAKLRRYYMCEGDS